MQLILECHKISRPIIKDVLFSIRLEPSTVGYALSTVKMKFQKHIIDQESEISLPQPWEYLFDADQTL